MAKKAINPIKNGTVIDHIIAGKGKDVLEILSLESSKEKEFLGIRVSSKKLSSGKKDIVMFENRKLSPQEFNIIALFSPGATVSTIENHEVKVKEKVKLPDFVEKFIVCPNPKCITNIEGIKTNFTVEQNGIVEIRCHYCEKKYPINGAKIKM